MKNLTILSLTIIFGWIMLQTACKSDAATSNKTYTSGLYLENMDTSVKPGDNFQMYVNGKWIKETEIPSDKSNYGIFGILNDESQENVKKIIESAAATENEGGSDEQKVGELYASYMDMDTRNSLGNAPLKSEFDKIEAISSYKELAKFFAYSMKVGYEVPLGFFIMADLKKPDEHAVYTWQGGLGLPEREYYLSETGKFPNLRIEYEKHIEKMLTLADVKNAGAAAKTIMALETTIAKEHMKKEQTRDMMGLYNAVPMDELDKLMPDFAWDDFFGEMGIPKSKLDFIVVTQLDFTKKVNGIIKNTSLDDWKTYLKWSVVDHAASRLSTDFDTQNFAFYAQTMRGVKEQQPQWRRAVGTVNGYLGEVVGKVYVKEHFPPEAKGRMSDLVDNLLKAYEVSIKDLDWMGEDTKKEALDKLSKFTTKIGYPDEWKSYPAEIKAKDLFGNLRRSELAEFDRELAKIGKPVDKKEWGMNPQTINAYYNPPQNEIVFPAAILQPPFFNLEADDAVNYGAIGGVIGHEIGHGFDDQGSTFDGDGVLRDWWTDQDRAEFKKRTGALVEQYNSFKVFDDLNVNGEFTLGENIGDLGGLSIALKAYKMSLNGKEAPVIDGFTGEQRVFLGWAQAWRSKSREEAMRNLVATNTHSPAIFRVNGVVRNIPQFYELFEVKEGDKLYLAPEERVKIW